MKMRTLLLPFSLLYGCAVMVRNWFFEKQILKTTTVEVPVISVGNIAVGGVGKTPLVELLIGKISAAHRCAVVSRGYGRRSSGVVVVNDGHNHIASVKQSGDEPGQLARKFPNAIVVVAEQRVRGAQRAIELGADVIILDDGFQHRYLHRDVNIAVVTAREVFEQDWLLPAGNRREPMSSLKRADIIVVSRCDDRASFDAAKNKLERFQKPVAGVRTKLKSFKRVLSHEKKSIEELQGKRVIAFSGIGNPESFERTITQTGAEMMEHIVYADHHWYDDEDGKKIQNAFEQSKADFIITTEKDAVRLQENFSESFLKRLPVYTAEIQLEFLAGENLLSEAVNRIVLVQKEK